MTYLKIYRAVKRLITSKIKVLILETFILDAINRFTALHILRYVMF